MSKFRLQDGFTRMIQRLKECQYHQAMILIALVVASWKYSFGLEQVIDLGLYDEGLYMSQGRQFLETGWPTPDWSPLYSLWYFLLSLWEPDYVRLYYLNYKLLIAGMPIVLYFLLRAMNIEQMVSIGLAFMQLIAFGNLPVHPKVSHFAFIIIFISLTFTARFYRYNWGISSLTVGLLLCSYIRPEFFISFVLISITHLVILVRYSQGRWKNGLSFLLVAILFVFFVTQIGLPFNGSRSMMAFGQHFSLNWVVWTDAELHPYDDWQEIVRQNLGEVNTPMEAMKANPKLFLQHIIQNMRAIPKEVLGQFWVHSPLFLPNLFIVEGIIFFGITGGWLFLKREQIVTTIRATWFRKRFFVLILLICMVPSFFSAVIIFPRDHYLFIPATLTVVLFAYLLSSESQHHLLSYQRLFIILVILVALTPAKPSWFLQKAQKADQPALSTVNFLRTLHITDEVNLLARGFYNVYLGDNFRHVTVDDKMENFEHFHHEKSINMVILSTHLENDSRLRDDPEWQAFLENHQENGYIRLEIPNSTQSVLISKDVLKIE